MNENKQFISTNNQYSEFINDHSVFDEDVGENKKDAERDSEQQKSPCKVIIFIFIFVFLSYEGDIVQSRKYEGDQI